jgi:hypothetical protein
MLSLLESLMRVISFRNLYCMLEIPINWNTLYNLIKVKILVFAYSFSLKITELQKEQSAGNYKLVNLFNKFPQRLHVKTRNNNKK